MDHIEAIEAALAQGPTPGPFVVLNDAVYRASYVDEGYPVVHVSSSQFMRLGDSLVAVDAAWFAACHPEAIRSLIARLREAEEALRAALDAGQAQPVAAMVRSRNVTTPARAAFDGVNHYSEWSEWIPVTYTYAVAVTDPNRNTDPKLYEMVPLYLGAAPPAPAAQPLTEEGIVAAFRAEGFSVITPHESEIAMRCARAVERAHGIGGTNG